jgi:hypothetical protein
MNIRFLIISAVCFTFAIGLLSPAFGDELKPTPLPQPNLDPGKSLVQALKDRKTTKEYAVDILPEQTISNLLWAAFGINRPDSGKRTAPSAYNRQEIDVYIATASGIYLYDPKANALVPVLPGDHRSLTYTQAPFFKDAPAHLVYIADLDKMMEGEEAGRMTFAAMHTGFIAQNVYLYCASEGLPTGFRISINKEKLGQAMKLRPNQRIIGAQSVGLPKGK